MAWEFRAWSHPVSHFVMPSEARNLGLLGQQQTPRPDFVRCDKLESLFGLTD